MTERRGNTPVPGGVLSIEMAADFRLTCTTVMTENDPIYESGSSDESAEGSLLYARYRRLQLAAALAGQIKESLKYAEQAKAVILSRGFTPPCNPAH